MPDPTHVDPRDLDAFDRLDELLRDMSPVVTPPPELRRRTLRAIASGSDSERPAARPRRRRPAWHGAAAAVAAAAALALAFVVVGGDEHPAPELRATLQAPGQPNITARADIVKTGIGREIEFRTDALPILPTGEYYELWFVAPGDAPGRPKRISAGTFHPDARGRSHVRLTAAADPEKYPELSVTAEPGDGNPRPSGVEVLRSR